MQTLPKRNFTGQLSNIAFSHGFYIVLIFVLIYFSVSTPYFLSSSNFKNLLHQSAPMMILASGFAMVVMSGKLDISIGSIAYLATGVGTNLLMKHDYPPAVALAVVLALGTLFGLFNGIIIVFLKVNPLITTMGTMFIYRGLGLLLTKSLTTSVENDLRRLGNSSIGPLYADFVLALIFPGDYAGDITLHVIRSGFDGHRKRRGSSQKARSQSKSGQSDHICAFGAVRKYGRGPDCTASRFA